MSRLSASTRRRGGVYVCHFELRLLPRGAAGCGSGVWCTLAIMAILAVKPRRGKLQLWQSLGESFDVSAAAVNRQFVRTQPSTSYCKSIAVEAGDNNDLA